MSTPAPGWYADAVDAALIRWWDGSTWSDHTQPNPAFATTPAEASPPPFAAPLSASAPVPPPFAEPVAASTVAAESVTDVQTPLSAAPLPTAAAPFVPPAADATPPRRAGRESTSPSLPISEPVRLVPPTTAALPGPAPETPDPQPSASFAMTPLATATPAPASASTPWTSSSSFAQPTASVDLASVDYEPMVRSWGAARGSSSGRSVTGVSTGGAWMLALSPLVNLGLFALVWVLTDAATAPTVSIIGGSLSIVAVLWLVIGAVADYRRLGALGHEYRPSLFWILVGPFMYLIARAIHVYRTTGRGVAPTWVFLALSVALGAVAGVVAASASLAALAP